MDHPHKGFETVTCVLQGAIAYEDFTGNKGILGIGDVQWMTAGRGIIHTEMAGGDGTNTAVQVWINLSSQQKMIEPRCNDVRSKDIPAVKQDGVEARILAGEAFGVNSPIYNNTQIMFLDFTLMPRAQLHQHIPESWNSFVYVIEGEGTFGSLSSPPIKSHTLLVLGHGDGLCVWNNTPKPLRFLLMAGKPLSEPVVHCGPFVMNTQSEIDNTLQDYRQFKNGFEMGKHWRC
ncbi:pirin-like protein [Abrus precatorius]|uniref:Pirin-like protein n=1 Tax=Abrus precatorius TaxID=3816 RepID=A0A8B8LNL4_ABRPR|nr:pirin-like protein [Abrus precatorius]